MPGRLPLPRKAGAIFKAQPHAFAYLVGAGLIAAGVGLVFWPAGLVVGGVFCLAVAVL